MRPIRCSILNRQLIIGSSGFIGASLLNLLAARSHHPEGAYLFDLRAISTTTFVDIAEHHKLNIAFLCCGHSLVSSSTKLTRDDDIQLSIYIKRYISLVPSIRAIVLASTALLACNSAVPNNDYPSDSPLYFYLQAKLHIESLFLSPLPHSPSIYCIRFSNVFGKSDLSQNRLIPYLKDCIMNGVPVKLRSSPCAELNLVYDTYILSKVVDYVYADLACSAIPKLKPLLAASAYTISLEELITVLQVQLECTVPPVSYGLNLPRCPKPLSSESPLLLTREQLISGLSCTFGDL